LSNGERRHKWTDKVIDQLARDLMREIPATAGFSEHNLYRMRAFYLGYDKEEGAIVTQSGMN